MNPEVTSFFDEDTFTISYVVADPVDKVCAIIDPVLGFDPASGCSNTDSADELIAFIEKHRLKLEWILETHVHADHLSGASHIQTQLGGKIAIGAQVVEVQKTFGIIFNAGPEFRRDGSQFEMLFHDADSFKIGGINATVIHTPGHTPACITYVIGDAAFVGDTLFMPDYGSARCDFPGGDARTLYDSIQRIFALPDETRLFMCHDYKAPGRDEYQWETTVKIQRQTNLHIHAGVSEDEFVTLRQSRDKTLSMPRLTLPAVQVNMRAGAFPPAEENGTAYLKLPINAF